MVDTLTVRNVRWFSDGIFEIEMGRDGLMFTPGDCVALFASDGTTSRPYSIASGTEQDSVRFIIRRMDEGAVSTYLSERSPGDVVKVSPPFGWFRPGPKDDGAPFVFVATGTGISPFLAYFRSQDEHPPVQCLYGVRQLADAAEADWLQSQCDVRISVSREKANGHHFGRVTDLLYGLPVEKGTHYYLCGLDAMIDDVTNWLESRDVPITCIHRECFFNSSYSASAPV